MGLQALVVLRGDVLCNFLDGAVEDSAQIIDGSSV